VVGGSGGVRGAGARECRHGNRARLDDDEKRTIIIDTPSSRQKIWCINEPGLYHLILTSRKPSAKAFKRWLTHEVLPELRQTGRYAIARERFLANTLRPTQVQHSREVGALQSAFGGKGFRIRWFRGSLKAITGHFPNEWRAIGREQHLPWPKRRRGREVVRSLQPEGACATSLADELVVNGVQEAEAIAIGQQSKPLFQRILATGVRPAELYSSPLDGVEEDSMR
jgi:hypothetical protein